MKINAIARLLADASPTEDSKKRQIENLKKSLPGEGNKRVVNPAQKDQVHKRINDLKNQIIDVKSRDRATKQNTQEK
jgi:hypothetical protein